jgi:hypothetical protein
VLRRIDAALELVRGEAVLILESLCMLNQLVGGSDLGLPVSALAYRKKR